MNMPNFTAEASLGRASRIYRVAASLRPSDASLQPAFGITCNANCLDNCQEGCSADICVDLRGDAHLACIRRCLAACRSQCCHLHR